MAKVRRRPRDPSQVPDELRPQGWRAFADHADLDAADPATFRASAMRRQSQALAAWADDLGLPWHEACRRAGRGGA